MNNFIKTILFLFCIIFISGCLGSNKRDPVQTLPSEGVEEQGLDTSVPEEPSIEQLVDHLINPLQGIYQGIYQTHHFEVWIEKIGQAENGAPIVAVLLFLKDKKEDIEQFLKKYQDADLYYNDVCTSFSYPRPIETNKIEKVENIGAENLWNSIGILAEIHLTLEKSHDFKKTRFYMKFQNQQHSFISLHKFNSGEARLIELDTQNLKQKFENWWNKSPIKIQLKKTSHPETGLLNKYYQTVEAIKQKFQDERKQHYRFYCPSFVPNEEAQP